MSTGTVLPEDVEGKVMKLLEILEEVVDKVFKKKKEFGDEYTGDDNTSRSKNKIPKEIRLLMRQKKEVSNRIVKSKSWLKTYTLTKQLRGKEEQLAEKYKERKLKVEQEAIKKMKTNPKYFYTYARQSAKTTSQVGTLVGSEGQLYNSPFEKAECLKQQYESVFTCPDPAYRIENINQFCDIEEGGGREPARGLEDEDSPWPEGQVQCVKCRLEVVHLCVEDLEPAAQRLEAESYRRRNPSSPEISSILPSIDNMMEAISKIPNNSSPGPDGVPPSLLKNAKGSMAAILLDIFQQSYETGDIPALWKLGLITPVHKGGSSSTPANFRPVSLTSHLMKTMERVVRENLVRHMDIFDKMDKNQHGSRKGRSTLSQLLEHHSEIVESLENNQNVDVIYLDFAKAFDKCDLGILMHKLKALGIKGKVLRWIFRFATNRRQKVVVSGVTSESTELISGVAQGTVLGPILFLIYVSDIGENITSSIKEYVDDTKVKKPVNNEEDVKSLQSDLDKIYEWAKKNNMKFNGSKFQVIKYGKNEALKNETEYFTENTEDLIERHETLRDLGVILSDTAKFDEHIETVAKKVRQKTGWVSTPETHIS